MDNIKKWFKEFNNKKAKMIGGLLSEISELVLEIHT